MTLHQKKAELDRLRPLSPRAVAELERWYDVELTYTSNSLEGNSLTRIETALLLESGITIGGKPLKDHLEAVGHLDALHYVRTLAATTVIRESDIRNIHRLIMQRIDPGEAGSYSTHQRLITGSLLTFPSPAELAPLMSDLAHWLLTAPATPETAFTAHLRLITIHPFSDGNGRTGRLLMNLILIRSGYPPIAIPPESRIAYLSALNASQEENNQVQYEAFLNELLQTTLDHHLRILTMSVAN